MDVLEVLFKLFGTLFFVTAFLYLLGAATMSVL